MHKLLTFLLACSLLGCGVADDDDSAPDDDDDIFAQDDDDTSGQDDDDTSGQDDDDTTGQDDDDSSGGSGGGGTSILGDWVDSEGTTYNMTESLWTMVCCAGTASFTLSKYSTSNQFAVGQNGANNPSHPSLFSRFEWVSPNGSDLFLCHRVQDGTDALSAGSVTPADPSAPTVSGCNEGPWTALIPA